MFSSHLVIDLFLYLHSDIKVDDFQANVLVDIDKKVVEQI